MNYELQKYLQLSDFYGGPDAYMLILLVIMVVTGALGGIANYYLGDRPVDRASSSCLRYAVLGVVAALTVPLFLNMISSNLLEAPRTRPVEFFVLGGFCLIYVVASRRLFENAANRLQTQMEQMKKEVVQLKKQQAVADLLPAVEPVASVVAGEPAREALSYNDVEIVRAISEESYVYGNLAGLTDKTGLARETVSSRLVVLKNLGILETRINEKNVLHWFVSAKGKQTLGDILSGQGERSAS